MIFNCKSEFSAEVEEYDTETHEEAACYYAEGYAPVRSDEYDTEIWVVEVEGDDETRIVDVHVETRYTFFIPS